MVSIPASRDGRLFWRITEGVLHFSSPPGNNIRMPIGSNDEDVLKTDLDTAAWSAIEQIWADGKLTEVGPGRWEMPGQDIYLIDRENRKNLGIPGEKSLKVHVSTVGVPGHESLGIDVEVHDPEMGNLQGTMRNGPFFFPELHGPILMPQSVYELLELVVAGPSGTRIEDHFDFLARVQVIAHKAEATMDGYLASEEYHFPEQVQIEIKEHSPDHLELTPVLNNPQEDVPPIAAPLLNRVMPRVHSATDRQGKRHRIVISDRIREQMQSVSEHRVIRGSQVPRFIENPRAFLPESIDLEEFSKRVRGFRTVVYNSRPYLHVRPGEGGWFEGIPGIALESISEEQPRPGELPGEETKPQLDPETYRKLAERAAQSNEEYVRHGDAWVHIDRKAADQYLNTLDKLEYSAQGVIRIPTRALLDIYENLEALEFELPPAESIGIQKRFSEFPKPAVPAYFRGELLPHQTIGYWWLAHLDEKGTGGLLADEMGLGKTVQVVVHLARLYSENRVRPSLIVCPKTLLENWFREIRRFLPDLNTTIITGGHVTASALQAQNCVLMSYDTLRFNQFEIGKVDWRFVACDEAQYAKNPTAQRTSAVKALKSDHRVALTGTPVENGMIEFWCIMDFVRPGLLGCWSDFRSGHERPLVEAGSDENRRVLVDQLLEKLGIHYVRRMKRDILRDLPAKTDCVIDASLSETQLEYYRRIAYEGRTGGKGAALAAITKLLILCAHPQALENYPGDFKYQPEICPKLDKTLQTLRQIQQAGEKALIFTRFIRIQHILQSAIRQDFGIWPDVLNGEITANRQQIVDIFSQRPGFNVMILSHDVGGIGLNITSANHVIHYTRPWNPAKENQGTDRSHRIGQNLPVTVYYPIVTDSRFDTVEARLSRLLESKQALARDVLRPTAEASVTADDLMACLNQDI